MKKFLALFSIAALAISVFMMPHISYSEGLTPTNINTSSSLEERGKQLRIGLDREYKKLSDKHSLPPGGAVDISSLVTQYISHQMQFGDVEQILHGAGFKITMHPAHNSLGGYTKNDAEASIDSHDNSFHTEKITIFVDFITEAPGGDYTKARTRTLTIVEEAIPSSVPKKLQEQGKHLRTAIDQAYKKLSDSLPSKSGINITPVITQYIPLGSSFDDAEQILRSAGFEVFPRHDHDLEGDSSNKKYEIYAKIDPYRGFFIKENMIGVSLIPRVPGDYKSVSEINASISSFTL
jgi:hypothetical protein